MALFIESLEDWQACKSLADCNRFMLNNEIDCDVTFFVGQKKEPVKAHRYILVSRSSVFQSIFCGSIIGDGGKVIPVSDIKVDTFKALLLFLYCDDIQICEDIVKDLLYAAKKYAVKGLVQKCLLFLEASINPQNVCSILEQVHLYDGKSLETKCISYIHENGTEVLKSDSIADLCLSCLNQIVCSDELMVDEKLVWKAAIKWASNECQRKGLQVTDESQRAVLGPTIYHIRFPLLDPVYFTNAVSLRNLLSQPEIISIFQFFNGRYQSSNWKFNSNLRRGYSIFSVIRFNIISMEEFTKIKSDGKECIKFSCSEPIILHGVVIYGCLAETGNYSVWTEIDCVTDSIRLSASQVNLMTTRSKHIYDVLLPEPVTLSTGKQYTVTLQLIGPPTKVGYNGKSDVMSEGVLFHFSNCENSNTTVEKGQIPGLLFTLPSHLQKEKMFNVIV